MPKRYTYEEVKEIFKENGYSLLSNRYVNNKTKLVCRDKDEYLFFITLNTVKNKDKSNFIDMSNPFSMRNIRKYIEIHSLKVELLTKEYVNNQYKMEWRCACGNIFYKDWAHFSSQNATRCNDCAQEIRTEKDIMNIEEVKSCFIKKGLIPLFDNYYKNDGYLKCMTKGGIY